MARLAGLYLLYGVGMAVLLFALTLSVVYLDSLAHGSGFDPGRASRYGLVVGGYWLTVATFVAAVIGASVAISMRLALERLAALEVAVDRTGEALGLALQRRRAVVASVGHLLEQSGSVPQATLQRLTKASAQEALGVPTADVQRTEIEVMAALRATIERVPATGGPAGYGEALADLAEAEALVIRAQDRHNATVTEYNDLVLSAGHFARPAFRSRGASTKPLCSVQLDDCTRTKLPAASPRQARAGTAVGLQGQHTG